MTTTIRVLTHSWPVEVKVKDVTGVREYTVTTEVLDPHCQRDFHVHSTRSLKITELPEPRTGVGTGLEGDAA